MDDSEDLHVCLKCHEQIQGLDSYVEHRKANCTENAKEENATDQPSLHASKSEKTTDAVIPLLISALPSEPKPNLAVIASDEDCTHKRKVGRPRKHPLAVKPGSSCDDPQSPETKRASVGGRYSPRKRKKKVLPDMAMDVDEMESDGFISDDNWTNSPTTRASGKKLSAATKAKRAKKLLTAEEKAIAAKSKVKNHYTCPPCEYSSINIYSMLQHMKTIKHSERAVDKEENTECWFKCETCIASFRSKIALDRHKKRHEQQCKCSSCGTVFMTRRELNKHRQDNHPKVPNPERVYARTACPICSKVMTKTHLKIHLRIHSGEKPYACDQCSFKCNQHGDLKIHKKRHFGIKDHKCHICDFVTVRSSTLKAHLTLHTNRERTEECTICQQKFYSKVLLKSHIHLKHELSRGHSCNFLGCTYKFKFKTELVSHMRKHTNEKPFLCSVCGYTGTTKQALNRHFRQHTGDKPFKCDHPGCSYRGRVSTHLTRHKRLHTGAKPYKCPYCMYQANTHENLRKHIRNTKKHEGLRVYVCKFCSDMKTDVYQELVHHIRQEHSQEYVTFAKVSHETGLLAEREKLICEPKKESGKDVGHSPQTGEDKIPAYDLAQSEETAVSGTSQVDQAIKKLTTEDASDKELYKEYILCRVVQNGCQNAEAGATKNEADDQGELHSLQMVTVGDGDATQAIEMMLQQASNSQEASEDYILL